jgi:hypothetical protein
LLEFYNRFQQIAKIYKDIENKFAFISRCGRQFGYTTKLKGKKKTLVFRFFSFLFWKFSIYGSIKNAIINLVLRGEKKFFKSMGGRVLELEKKNPPSVLRAVL